MEPNETLESGREYLTLNIGVGAAQGHARYYSSAEPSFPAATSFLQSDLHSFMLLLSFLFPSNLDIQPNNKFSSSGTKNDESNDKMVSKLAEDEVM